MIPLARTNKYFLILCTALATGALLWSTGCKKENKACCPGEKTGAHTGSAHAGAAPGAGAAVITGSVVKTMDVPGYTYVLLQTAADTVWAAGPTCSVRVGDTLQISSAMPMKEYQSKTLNRTFESIYFVGSLDKKGALPAMGSGACVASAKSAPAVASPHGAPGKIADAEAAGMDFSGIKKPLGGKTVAELFAQKNSLAGKNVTLRAKVVKASNNIMGKNWLHVRDGSGVEGANDLVVTTTASIAPGKLVRVAGVLGKDKNIGAGYIFPLIIEDAQVTEQK